MADQYTTDDNDDAPRDLSKRSVQRLQQQPTQLSPRPNVPPPSTSDKALAILRQLLPENINAKSRKQRIDDQTDGAQ